jgi:cytochrome c553
MWKKLSIAVLAAWLAGCTEEPQSQQAAVDIEAGRQFAQEHCIGCHTLEGAGKSAEIPNLAGQPAAYLADAMYAYREGRRHHAALKEMIAGASDADVANIAAYFASLPPVAAAPEQPGADDAYHEGENVAAACIRCHGERGFSTTPGVPSLAGQHPVYLIVATQEYASGSRGHVEKAQMLSGLNDVDIEKMAMYFAAQAPRQRAAPPFGDPAAGEPQTATCGRCHGARGISPDPMVPNLAGQEPTYLVNAIKAYRDHERSHEDMVADKSDEEIENIAAYYAVQTAGSDIETGQELTAIVAKCDRCHGQTAGESTMAVPALRGQKEEYLLRVMKEYRDKERGNSMMHKMSAGYSDMVLEELAAYYAAAGRSQP